MPSVRVRAGPTRRPPPKFNLTAASIGQSTTPAAPSTGRPCYQWYRTRMFRGVPKKELFCLLTVAIWLMTTRFRWIEPVHSLDIFGDDCPDNEMRKPPRFGKRMAPSQATSGSNPTTSLEKTLGKLVRYRRSPCFRGPVRRRMLISRSGGFGAGGAGAAHLDVEGGGGGMHGSGRAHHRVPITILNRYLMALASAASSVASSSSSSSTSSSNPGSSSEQSQSDESPQLPKQSTTNYFSAATGSSGSSRNSQIHYTNKPTRMIQRF